MADMAVTEIPDYVQARFWAKVDVRGQDDCWEWTGFVARGGYGMFNLLGKTVRAHRLCYILSYGPIPEGYLACHHCDNRKCCNPTHIFSGTHHDNVMDMVRKGRDRRPPRDESKVNYVRGTKVHNSKLTDADIPIIRRRAADGDKHTHIAADFGVDRSLIYQIAKGYVWAHVPDAAIAAILGDQP